MSLRYIVLLLTTLFFTCIWLSGRNSKGKRVKRPTNWPIIGILPELLVNLHRIHDFMADLLEASGGTYVLKGSWFGKRGMLITCDPANINHILSKKFHSYGKGPQFKKIFADLGDGIFIAEAESWEFQRKTTHAILHHQGFVNFLVTSTWNKVEKGMIPLLDHFAKLGVDVDLQELFQCFSFDLTCVLLFDYDPVSLSVEFPKFPCKQALSEAEDSILYRHILPESIWKLQQRFRIGNEKKLRKAVDVIDEFLYNRIASKREKLNTSMSFQEECFDFLTCYMKSLAEKNSIASDIPVKILRDTMLSFIFAGTESIGVALTWFFWLMAMNPSEEVKIREEIIRNLHEPKVGLLSISKAEEMNKLIYLHAALCETLRLFPSIPLNHKAPVEADILPSGHHLKTDTKTLLCFYSMGRMERIWGEDCLEFKPSRWISKQGGIKHEPSFKFTAFNAGPRSCLGKDMSFIEMKMVAAALIYHFQFKVVEGQTILPSPSILLHMKNGLKVRVSKRAIHH